MNRRSCPTVLSKHLQWSFAAEEICLRASYIGRVANLPSQKPHERMITNVESIEVLLQVAFGRGIKYMSTPPNDPNYDRFLQAGEKLCVASLKSFLVSSMHRKEK